MSAADRGLAYGDGLFETMAVVDGWPRLWPRHRERLLLGCRRLGISPPPVALLEAELAELCSGATRAVLKLTLTRGGGGRGYAAPARARATRILALQPWTLPPAPAGGVRVRLCSTRLGINPVLAGIKHLNRLEQVLARSEWDDPAIFEGLVQDHDGRVVEGTFSNLFLVRGGELSTPDLGRCGVAGVMRAEAMARAAELGIPVHVGTIDLGQVRSADELFLTGSLIGIRPVRELDGVRFEPGPITARLQRALAPLLEGG